MKLLMGRRVSWSGGAVKECSTGSAILNLHERIENKLFLDRTRKDSNFKRPHICATLFQIEKCWLVVPKLDRLARSVPDARQIADELVARGVRLALGSSVYDPADPYGQNVLQHPGHLRRVRGRPDPAAHPRGHGGRACTGKAERETAEAVRTAAKGTAPDARH